MSLKNKLLPLGTAAAVMVGSFYGCSNPRSEIDDVLKLKGDLLYLYSGENNIVQSGKYSKDDGTITMNVDQCNDSGKNKCKSLGPSQKGLDYLLTFNVKGKTEDGLNYEMKFSRCLGDGCEQGWADKVGKSNLVSANYVKGKDVVEYNKDEIKINGIAYSCYDKGFMNNKNGIDLLFLRSLKDAYKESKELKAYLTKDIIYNTKSNINKALLSMSDTKNSFLSDVLEKTGKNADKALWSCVPELLGVGLSPEQTVDFLSDVVGKTGENAGSALDGIPAALKDYNGHNLDSIKKEIISTYSSSNQRDTQQQLKGETK